LLFPSSLRILDSLGVYAAIHKPEYDLMTTSIRDVSFQKLQTVKMSKDERYSYNILRTTRDDLVRTLVTAVEKQSIPIYYEHKLLSIEEKESAVECGFSNGIKKSASLVVGADGLRSAVRQISFPEAPSPVYTGQVGFFWIVPVSALNLSAESINEISTEASSMTTPQGTVLFVPRGLEGTEVVLVSQRGLPDREFSEWKALAQDKTALIANLYETEEAIPEPVKSAIEYAESTEKNAFFLWPYYVLPTTNKWISKNGSGRVLLLGDAAHALPPVGGQGAGQAIEDADGLGLGLSEGLTGSIEERLSIWSEWRQDRIGKVVEYATALRNSRMARPATGDEQPKGPSLLSEDMSWLHNWDSKTELRAWVEEKGIS